MKAAGADLSRISVLPGATADEALSDADRELNLHNDMQLVREAIQSTPDCRLLIIDPLNAYMGKTDTHKDAESRDHVLKPLARLADELDIAVISVMHFNKAEKGPKYRTAGSMAFVAAPRSVWSFSHCKDDPTGERRLMICLKNNLGPERGNGLAFRLVESPTAFDGNPQLRPVEWEQGAVAISANEALAEPKHRRGPSGDACTGRGLSTPSAGQWATTDADLTAEAEAYGVRERTLDRALKAMSE